MNKRLPDEQFDALARACYRQATEAVPPQLQFKLRPRPETRIHAGGWQLRGWPLGAALAGTAAAAVLAVGLGIGWQGPTPQPQAPQQTAAVGNGNDAPSTLLDEDPDFYAWLGSSEARQLAME